ncbi:hypothetical protein Tco_0493458 [Tanacetum coccineum]
MCKFALTMSLSEPKNIKEAMANSAWIEAMQEELHQFNRLDVWELVDRPLYKNVINMKWLWKSKTSQAKTFAYAHKSFPIYQMDVKTAFLNGPQKEECVFDANHDACITKLQKEVNSRAKIQSQNTRNSNKLVDQKSHTQKHSRQIFTRHRFSPNKTSAVYEKTYPRSDLRWKPMGRIFKSVGLRWIPTGKLFDSCTRKDDSEPTHGSNVDIPNIHESKQTLDLSAGTSIYVQKEQSLDLSAETIAKVDSQMMIQNNDICTKRFKPRTTMSTEVHQAAETVTTSNELDLLFGPLFDEYFNEENQVVTKYSAVTTTDASNKRQQQPDSTSSTSTLATTVTANGNFDL